MHAFPTGLRTFDSFDNRFLDITFCKNEHSNHYQKINKNNKKTESNKKLKERERERWRKYYYCLESGARGAGERSTNSGENHCDSIIKVGNMNLFIIVR